MAPAEFAGAATPLGLGDIAAAAAVAGVPAASIRVVEMVESNGRGFHPDSRRPVILFEPHIFSRRTQHRFDVSHPDISYPVGGAKPYPAEQDARYEQLFAAMALDEAAALSSASWGLFQIMGYHYGLCGFTTVQGFVRAMVRSEGEQLLALVRFIRAQPPMLEALREADWHAFAREYNGADYARNAYDQKLKAAAASLKARAG